MHEYHNNILLGDCIALLDKIDQPFVDMVFADPPFNVGFRYDKYHDKLEKNNYLAWTRDWMAACLRVLKPHGSFYVAIADDYAAHIRIIGEELGLTVRNWIIWHYTFGQQTTQKFAKSHTHILYFVRDVKNFVFNDLAVRIPSDRQLYYNDARAVSIGKIASDTWNCYSRVCGSFKERQGWHPCQMPELLLARAIAVSSNPGDMILDPFSGSGTTAAAALQLGRNYCGFDISEDYVINSRKRLADLKTQIEANRTAPLNHFESFELKRLFVEMGIHAQTILDTPLFLEAFIRQFHIRMNNGKTYDRGAIQKALKELTTWVAR
ncbi:DNA-methyltransferase [Anaerohalosphaeraceae bacterium U12dextr]